MTDFAHSHGPEESDNLGAQGDDVWDTEAEVTCPYCGEGMTIGLDPSGGPVQTYIEDCQVCCQPWRVQVHYDDRGVARVSVEAP